MGFSDQEAERAATDFAKEVFGTLGLSEQDRYCIRFDGEDSNEGHREYLEKILEENLTEDTWARKVIVKGLKKLDEHSN